MRILFFVARLDYGGAERQLILLAGGLARKGHGVAVAAMKAGPLDTLLADAGVPLVNLAKRGPLDIVGYFRRCADLLRHMEPDVIHGYLASANVSAALSRAFYPRGRVVFGIRSSAINFWSYGLGAGIYQIFEKFLSRFAHATIFNSFAGQDWTRMRGYHIGQTAVIPNGIDIERFRPNETARLELRSALGISNDTPVIAMLARYDPMKDHETFLDAAYRYDKNAHYLLAGLGVVDSNEHLRAMIDRRGLSTRVHLLGVRSDPENIWPAADICSLSSRHGEGWPNTLGEAMACGVPCVATDVGESQKIIGELGIVVPTRDPTRLSDGWRVMRQRQADDPALSEKLRARVEAEFSVARLVDQTELFLRALVDDSDHEMHS